MNIQGCAYRVLLGFAVAACVLGAVRAESKTAPSFAREAVDYPAAGLAFRPFAAASAEPLDLPYAHAFLISEGEKRLLEDRYDVFDLWQCATVCLRERDAAGNRFTLARFRMRYPDDPEGTLKTRQSFYADALELGSKDASPLRVAAYMAAPFETGALEVPRRAQRKNLKELFRLTTTNACQTAFLFRPVSSRKGGGDAYLVALSCAEAADAEAAEDALDLWLDTVREIPEKKSTAKRKGREESPSETALWERDFRLNVTNYPAWRVTASPTCVIADELASFPEREALVGTLTNLFPKYRAAYAERCPTPLAATVPPAAVRLFATKDGYLNYVGPGCEWTAAVWRPDRRELVIYLSEAGTDGLMKTVWHEAFHQYLDYAAATVSAAPWFNEGHAQLFEYAAFDREGGMTFGYDREDMDFVRSNAEKLADYLPKFLMLDYPAFYVQDVETGVKTEVGGVSDADGRQRLRLLHYRLAWSVAYFLEVGAPNVRFEPFRNVRADYLRALVRTRRADQATARVLDDGVLPLLVNEWKKFYGPSN